MRDGVLGGAGKLNLPRATGRYYVLYVDQLCRKMPAGTQARMGIGTLRHACVPTDTHTQVIRRSHRPTDRQTQVAKASELKAILRQKPHESGILSE